MSALLPSAAREAPLLGLYGGSFDPVHLGHLHCAEVARAAAELDHVLLVPARRPPHKPGRELADGQERLEMCLRAVEGRSWCSVWGVELERQGPSFTIDTLRSLAALRGGPQGLHLILGDDNLPGLASWREVEELLRLAQPIVVHRSEEADSVLAGLAGELSEAARARLSHGLARCESVAISSTELRARIQAGEDPSSQLPEGVWEYVRGKGIYGAG